MLSLFLLIEFLFFITILNCNLKSKFMFGKNDLIYFGAILLLNGKDRFITDSQIDEAVEVASIVFNKVFTDEN